MLLNLAFTHLRTRRISSRKLGWPGAGISPSLLSCKTLSSDLVVQGPAAANRSRKFYFGPMRSSVRARRHGRGAVWLYKRSFRCGVAGIKSTAFDDRCLPSARSGGREQIKDGKTNSQGNRGSRLSSRHRRGRSRRRGWRRTSVR
jgi:hypothetical protein